MLLKAAGESGSRQRPEAWVEPLLRGMMEVMHDRGVRVRKLPKDAEALAAAYRLLTDAREGTALLRDVAASLSREYRQVVKAMRKRAIPDDRSSRSSGTGGVGGGDGALLRLPDVRDILQDCLPEVLGSPDAAMAALLYLLYHTPHCLARGGRELSVGWKDVFKAFRAIKCRHPDGTSRVGMWDAEELARREDGSRSASASDYSSDPEQRSHNRASGGRRRSSSYGGTGRDRDVAGDYSGSGGGRRHRHHPRQPQPTEYDRYYDSRDSRGHHHHHRHSSPGHWDVRAAGGVPYPPQYGPHGYLVDPHMDPEAVAAAAAAMAGGGLDPATAAALQQAAKLGRKLSYSAAHAAVSPAEDPAVAAVRKRMASDLRMSKAVASPSARRLNLSLRELSRRKVHPERRVVNLEAYTAPDGKHYSLDPATGESGAYYAQGAGREDVQTAYALLITYRTRLHSPCYILEFLCTGIPSPQAWCTI